MPGHDIIIFDSALRRKRKRRAAAIPGNYKFLQDYVARHIAARLEDINRSFPLALDLGNGAMPPGSEKIGTVIRAAPESGDTLTDPESLPFSPSTFDLVCSNLFLHSVNDLPGTLLQIRDMLKPDGFFLAALFGGETLRELRESLMQAELAARGGVSPRVFPFADKPQMAALLQRAGFALPVVDSEVITVTYQDMPSLMHDLRGMGETNVIRDRSRLNPGKSFFAKAGDYYARHFRDPDERIRASFEIIFLAGWCPHATQQKPLRPGSARMRLADALGSQEHSSGERATP